jgi:Tol biopolymer transport system component
VRICQRAWIRSTSLGSVLLSIGACAPSNGGARAAPDGATLGSDATRSPTDANDVADDGVTLPPMGDADLVEADATSVPPPIDDADTSATDAGPGGPWIAFVSNRTGDYDIYLVHDDGTDLHAIVEEPGSDLYPTWSPDGARIAFASNGASDAGTYQLFAVDVASGAVASIATGLSDVVSPAWSPDGARLAVGGPGGLYTVPATGGTAAVLTSGGFRDNSPAWAPDGTVIYFSSNRADGGTFDVWSVQPDGGGLAQVTTGTGVLGGPAVSPDGSTIALAQAASASGVGTSTQVAFFATRTNGIVLFSAQGDSQPAFSPDGAKLVVTSTRYAADNPELTILGIPGATSPFRLTNSPGVDGQGVYQPGR